MANEQNIKPHQFQKGRSSEEAAKAGKIGGIASGAARRERKTLAETLRLVLEEKIGEGSELSKREAIVAKVVKRLYDEGDIRDLKILADVLGESEQTINLKGVAPIVAKDAEDAAKIQGLLDSVAARKNGWK